MTEIKKLIDDLIILRDENDLESNCPENDGLRLQYYRGKANGINESILLLRNLLVKLQTII